jgi:HK97 family phage prohead protease
MIENRTYAPESAELRAYTEGDKKMITGYAAKFEVQSRLLAEGGKVFNEVLRQGAFKDVTENDVYLTFNHNRDQVYARTINNTLTLTEDEVGLRFEATLNNTTGANDLYAMIERGDVVSNSFAFMVDKEGQQWSRSSDGNTIRTISRISKLIDVSVVVHPAYDNTEVAVVRGVDEYIEQQEPVKINDEPYKDMAYLLKLKNK